MRAVVILHTSNVEGGASSVFRSVVPRFVAAGVEILTILPDHGRANDSMCAWLEEHGMPYEVMRYRWWCIELAKLARKPWLALRAKQLNARADRAIANVIVSWGADVVLVFDGVVGVGYDAARNAGIPAIGYLQEVPTSGHGMRFYSEGEVRRKLAGASGCVAISSYVRDEWARWVDPSRVTVVPNGVQPDHVWSGPRTYAPDGIVRVTLAGSVVPTKGQMLLVEALERLLEMGETRLHVRMFGARPSDPSPYEEQVRERISTGPAAKYVELLPYEPNIAEVWGTTDVVVSASAAEGFGLALAEGMASGCAVVGPNCGAVPELLADGRGLLYSYGDANELSQKLACAARLVRSGDPARICTGRAYARALTPQRQGDALLDVLGANKG